MPNFLVIGLFAVFCLPVSALASEDADPFIFGGDVNYEVGSVNALKVPDAPPPAANAVTPVQTPDFTPPPSNAVSAQAEVPMLQKQTETSPEDTKESRDGQTPLPLETDVDKNQTLTDNLKNDSPAADGKNPLLPNIEGTWVDKLSEANPLALIVSKKDGKTSDEDESGEEKDSLESMVDSARKYRGRGRSNASVFDISGIMLRMSLKQVDRIAANRGFRKIHEKLQIPNFIKWRNEEYCRNRGVVGYERVQACVHQKAKKDKHEYIQVTKYVKYDTKEEIEVTFTSNFTDNKVYKIVYKSMAAAVTGNSPKAVYLRNIKVYDFWKKINQKYGNPDNKETVTWGLGGNKPFLKAQTGYLLLEDPMLQELDYTRMSREDARYMNTDLYSF